MPEYWWVAGLALIAAAGWLTSVLIAVRHVRKDRRMRRDAERRAQAEHVSGWPEPSADPQPVALLNRSDEPVYDAVATFVFIDGSGPTRGEDIAPSRGGWRIRVGVIPPGRWRVRVDGGWNGMYSRLGIEVAFTDCTGAHWVRRADGQLEQLPRSAFEYFAAVPPAGTDAARAGRRRRTPTRPSRACQFLLPRRRARPALVGPLCLRLDRHHRQPPGRLRRVRPPPSGES